MAAVFRFLLRLLLVATGLAIAAVLSAAFVLLLAVWWLRAGWARLTGRPVTPFVMRVDPRAGFAGVVRRAQPESRTPRADGAATRLGAGDVTDVQVKAR
jgi:hypothetical protein